MASLPASMARMLNYIWFGLMAIALVVAAFNGTADAVTRGAVESAGTAVQIALGLVGIMTLWLGIMRVAEAAGLVALIGRLLRPVAALAVPGRASGTSRRRRTGPRRRRQHARPEQRGHAARHQGHGISADLNPTSDGDQRDGHLHGADHVRRPAHSGHDDRSAGRRRRR